VKKLGIPFFDPFDSGSLGLEDGAPLEIAVTVVNLHLR